MVDKLSEPQAETFEFVCPHYVSNPDRFTKINWNSEFLDFVSFRELSREKHLLKMIIFFSFCRMETGHW